MAKDETPKVEAPQGLQVTRGDHSPGQSAPSGFVPTDRISARLVVRRVKDARYPDALFPVWRYHPFFTNSTRPTVEADIVHRRHAIIETTFADLIDACADPAFPAEIVLVLSNKADAYGLPGEVVDGMDVLAVHR